MGRHRLDDLRVGQRRKTTVSLVRRSHQGMRVNDFLSAVYHSLQAGQAAALHFQFLGVGEADIGRKQVQDEGGVAAQQIEQGVAVRACNSVETADGFALGNGMPPRQAAGAAAGEQRLLEGTGVLNRRLARLPVSGFVHARPR